MVCVCQGGQDWIAAMMISNTEIDQNKVDPNPKVRFIASK